MVLVYGEVLSQNQVFDLLENLSGEKLERHYVSNSSTSVVGNLPNRTTLEDRGRALFANLSRSVVQHLFEGTGVRSTGQKRVLLVSPIF